MTECANTPVNSPIYLPTTKDILKKCSVRQSKILIITNSGKKNVVKRFFIFSSERTLTVKLFNSFFNSFVVSLLIFLEIFTIDALSCPPFWIGETN